MFSTARQNLAQSLHARSTHGISDTSRGLAGIVFAQVTWGLQPLFWMHLSDIPAPEAVAHRVIWSFVFATAIAMLLGSWIPVRALARDWRSLRTSVGCGLLMLVNWSLYVYAILSGHIVEAALALFLLPLTTVLAGVLFLREKLRPAQWVSVAIGAAAIVVVTVGYGKIPWLALGMSFAVAAYSLWKKRLDYPPMAGMAIENAVPVIGALGLVGYLGFQGTSSFGHSSVTETVLLVCTGIITTVPLALFAYALQRIPLTLAGIAQYLNAMLQFLIGVFIAHETVGAARWAGFVLIWIALAIFTAESVHHNQRRRRKSAYSPTQRPAMTPSTTK